MLKKTVFFVVLFFVVKSFTDDTNLLYLGSGINNVRRKKRSQSTEFKVEYKFYNKFWIFHPLIGISLSTKKQLYAYGGISLDLIIKKHIAFVPNFAIGYYARGNGKDLGFPLEFRTGIELAYILQNMTRLGCHISHTSNASLGRKNPGLETFIFFIAIPIKY